MHTVQKPVLSLLGAILYCTDMAKFATGTSEELHQAMVQDEDNCDKL